jgi:hypothetical protein
MKRVLSSIIRLIVLCVMLWGCGKRDHGAAPAQTRPGSRSLDASLVGKLGPLLPFHKDAIAAGLTIDAFGFPKICFWMRPAEYAGTDLVDPGPDPVGQFKPAFDQLVYGGYPFSDLLDGSVKSRIKADIPLDNAQCFDLSHPDAFNNTGKYLVTDLTADDFALNAAAFTNAGSRGGGLNYNVFCSGNAALPDGRWVIVGGTDKIGNAGTRKINLFDPNQESWAPRPEPRVKSEFEVDPSGTQFQHGSALDESNTDPPNPSDMKYQRWYPTAVTLPDGRVLVLSGTDEDTSAGPASVAATKVRQQTPEIYDPASDSTLALENARKLLMMYPRSYVVQTGPGVRDWEVAVIGAAAPPLPTPDMMSQFDPYTYDGKTYQLDVLGAAAAPERDVPAEDYWTLVATASLAHDDGAGAALWALDDTGLPSSQKIVLFGGTNGRGSDSSDIVEMIDFEDAIPAWRQAQPLQLPASQNNAVVLPDGKIVIVGGRAGRGSTTVITYAVQLFDPDTGQMQSLVETTVPRHDHSTALLLPDASVIMMGGNRTELVPGNSDAGVPVAQIYQPAYLFRGPRPVIDHAPATIAYGDRFSIAISGENRSIGSVVLIRMGPITHNWDWGNRYVRLSFEQPTDFSVTAVAPLLPASAVPGQYLLFIVGADGVPSVGQLVHLGS